MEPNTILSLKTRLSDISKQIGEVKGSITSSGGYGGQAPTSSYLTSQETLLKSLQKQYDATSDRLITEQWYPKSDTSVAKETTTDPGWIGSILDKILIPQRAVVGGVMHAVGQGKTGSLFGDMWDNAFVRKEGMSDVLRTAGAPGPLAAVAGFGMDVGTDPLTYLLPGAEPLLAMGLKGAIKGGAKELAEEGALAAAKGAAKGLAVGTTANVLRKATSVGKYTPYFKESKMASGLAESTAKAMVKYRTLTGTTGLEFLDKTPGVLSKTFSKAFDPAAQLISKKFTAIKKEAPWLQGFIDSFPYHPERSQGMHKIIQALQEDKGIGKDFLGPKLSIGGGENIAAKMLSPESLAALGDSVGKLTGKKISTIGELSFDEELTNKLQTKMASMIKAKTPKEAYESIAADLDQSYGQTLNPTKYYLKGSQEINKELFLEAVKEKAAKLNIDYIKKDWDNMFADVPRIPFAGTGYQKYDNAMKHLYQKRITLGQGAEERMIINFGKIMNRGKDLIDTMKISKVGMSTSSIMNNFFSNITFDAMVDASLLTPEGADVFRKVAALLHEAPGSAIDITELIKNSPNPNLMKELLANQSNMNLLTGGTATFLSAKRGASSAADEYKAIAKMAKNFGISIPDTPTPESVGMIKEVLKKIYKQLPTGVAKERMASSGLLGLKIKGERGGLDAAEKQFAMGRFPSQIDMPQTMQSLEMGAGNVRKFQKKIGNIAAGTTSSVSPIHAVNLVLNKLPNEFEKIDQIFKLQTVLYGTCIGYDTGRLAKINQFLPLKEADLTGYTDTKTGIQKYTLSADKAIQLAQIKFLNYAEMPRFVKVARNFPLLGQPFASFVYGNAIKTGTTFVKNPSFFNKVSFAMNDFGGAKTPLEKQAIYDPKSSGYKYYSYLGKSGMYRVPYTSDSPLYVNMAQALPYLSTNIFAPETRKYETPGAGETFMSFLDRTGLFSGPGGSMIKNYIIQPMMIQDELQMLGTAGQPLFPIGASALEKAGYLTRDTAETFVPAALAIPLGYTAPLLSPVLDPQAIPLYSARRIAEGFQNKNSLGKTTKEPAASKVLRGTGTQLGINVQSPMNTSFNQ